MWKSARWRKQFSAYLIFGQPLLLFVFELIIVFDRWNWKYCHHIGVATSLLGRGWSGRQKWFALASFEHLGWLWWLWPKSFGGYSLSESWIELKWRCGNREPPLLLLPHMPFRTEINSENYSFIGDAFAKVHFGKIYPDPKIVCWKRGDQSPNSALE